MVSFNFKYNQSFYKDNKVLRNQNTKKFGYLINYYSTKTKLPQPPQLNKTTTVIFSNQLN